MVELDSSRQKQAREYAKKRRRLGLINFVLSSLFIAVLILTSISGFIVDRLPGPPPVAAGLYLALLLLAYDVATLPLTYQSSFKLPTFYGLLHQTFSDWIADHFKSLIMSMGFGILAAVVLFALLEISADWWWLFSWVLLLLVTLAMTVLAPVLILPLFYKTHPIDEGELKERLMAVAKKSGVKVSGIYIIEFSEKTTLANAAVMGLGRTKRIVISDTLLQAYTPGEIDVVMAHELAHQRHADVWRLFAAQSIVLFGVFWLASLLYIGLLKQTDYVSISDPAALPLLLFCITVAGAPSLPIISWVSRRLEAAADSYALELSGKPEVFISAMTKLTNQNLGEARPSNFLERIGQDHPSYVDRVKMADNFIKNTTPDHGV